MNGTTVRETLTWLDDAFEGRKGVLTWLWMLPVWIAGLVLSIAFASAVLGGALVLLVKYAGSVGALAVVLAIIGWGILVVGWMVRR